MKGETMNEVSRAVAERAGEVLRAYENHEAAEGYGTVLWVRRELGRPIEYVVCPWYAVGASDFVRLGVCHYFPVMSDGIDAIVRHDEAVAAFWKMTNSDQSERSLRAG